MSSFECIRDCGRSCYVLAAFRYVCAALSNNCVSNESVEMPLLIKVDGKSDG